ncbi:Uncharacterised protein [Mycobacteroides abscessus subsp. abscessus]|nr:Uncharacterised protein [Mycobacteroides abscessus subsp. abscessus]
MSVVSASPPRPPPGTSLGPPWHAAVKAAATTSAPAMSPLGDERWEPRADDLLGIKTTLSVAGMRRRTKRNLGPGHGVRTSAQREGRMDLGRGGTRGRAKTVSDNRRRRQPDPQQ